MLINGLILVSQLTFPPDKVLINVYVLFTSPYFIGHRMKLKLFIGTIRERGLVLEWVDSALL